jgi:hypothetical protein
MAHHWPPKTELRGQFHPQSPPSAILPLVAGEPLLIGNAAGKHRRSAGFAWPPEAQVPYANDPIYGVGRIPLVTAWTALLPRPGVEEGLVRRVDLEFKWRPEGIERAEYAGKIIALSIKAFLIAAGVSQNSSLIAIVVPDALDEAGQQILLDRLAEVGFSLDRVHLLPRPLATALRWCSSSSTSIKVPTTTAEEGDRVGRLRLVTMAFDVWEAVSFEVRSRQYGGRTWLVPLRDRSGLAGALPELPLLGVTIALALAYVNSGSEILGWWSRAFTTDWLAEKLATARRFSPQEVIAVREACSAKLSPNLQWGLKQLITLEPLWSRLFQYGAMLQSAVSRRWEDQEMRLDTHRLSCLAVLADGAFSCPQIEHSSNILSIVDSSVQNTTAQVQYSHQSAVMGAALAAAAIAHELPCYRETLLPLDLGVRSTDEYGDLKFQWKPLVGTHSVEAGRTWRSPTPITGLQIEEGQDHLLLPLRRTLHDKSMFRQVGTELATAAKCSEPVRIEIKIKPGQGFARVRIESITPGVFATRLDWRTMKECAEPKLELAYLPSVSRILPNREMFERAQHTLETAFHALKQNSSRMKDRLSMAVDVLNKWPLAHEIERTVARDFMLHYGIIGSDGALSKLPDLARDLRDAIGKKFGELVQKQNVNSDLGRVLLRAGAWFYLAIPEECLHYLRVRLAAESRNFRRLSVVELHAIGLAFETTEDLHQFYLLVVQALCDSAVRPNNWLRAVRNICRFRNHALYPSAVSDSALDRLIQRIFETLKEQAEQRNFGQIFRNCLETIPFLLKRRRYDREFLAPTSPLTQELISFLERINRNRRQLPSRLQSIPRATVNFLRMEATASDIEALLGVEEEDDSDD